MAGFVFNGPPRIVCAAGAVGQAGEQLRRLGAERVLVVSDAGVARSGGLGLALEALRAAGVAHRVFQEVPSDPPEDTAIAAAAAAVEMRAEGVLGIGGGSVMDVAKVAALLATGHDALSEIYGIGLAEGPRLPLVLAPSLAGSGAEATPIAVLVAGGEKKAVVSAALIADVVLADVDLTLGAPSAVTAAAGAGAVALAVEAFTSAHANANPLSRALAAGALGLLAWALPLAVADGGERRAREALCAASLMVGQAFANAPAAAAHALAYPLVVSHFLPSGVAAALLLPHVVRFSLPAASHAYAELAARLIPEAGGDAAARAEALARRLAALFAGLGLPETLAAAGVAQDDLPALVPAALRQTRLLANNPRPVMAQDIAALYKAAWG